MVTLKVSKNENAVKNTVEASVSGHHREGKKNGEVFTQAEWPTQPDLITVSAALSD